MKFHLEKAHDHIHKYIGVFDDKLHIKFGAYGYEDYTQHKNPIRKKLYIQRHQAREDWKDPTKKGTLSRYILWETPNIETNVKLFKQKFNLD